jgi:radical SAM protein with 4Fe4S-binding SPASM domain
LPFRLGNIKEDSFSKIWAESEIFKCLRDMKYSGKCGACNYRVLCGGCRARAYYFYEDYMAQEPWCSYTTSKDIKGDHENERQTS